MRFQAVLNGHSSAKFEGEVATFLEGHPTLYRVTCKCGKQFSSGKAGDENPESSENENAWRIWHQHVIWKLTQASIRDVGVE